jgi:hypothetical protein
MEGAKMKSLLLEGMMAAAVALAGISGPAVGRGARSKIGGGGRL